jgi:hypothetical protein
LQITPWNFPFAAREYLIQPFQDHLTAPISACRRSVIVRSASGVKAGAGHNVPALDQRFLDDLCFTHREAEEGRVHHEGILGHLV